MLEQEVPPWRGNEGESNQAEGGAQSMFVGSIVVRVVEIDNQHWDYHKHIGTDRRYTWTFKCQTSKSQMKKTGPTKGRCKVGPKV